MAVVNQQVTVAATATVIIDTNDLDGSNREGAFSGSVVNQGSASIYLGDSSVTTANGAELTTGSSVQVTLREGDVLYGIVASGTETAGYVGTDYVGLN